MVKQGDVMRQFCVPDSVLREAEKQETVKRKRLNVDDKGVVQSATFCAGLTQECCEFD